MTRVTGSGFGLTIAQAGRILLAAPARREGHSRTPRARTRHFFVVRV
jgi:hypothetical protein